MRIGIGLPSTIAGAPASLLGPWARAAEAGPFATVAVHDRPAWDGLDPLSSLAIAAAVTERMRLATLVLIAPLRPVALLAQQAATVHRASGGRLLLGLGTGPRRDDYRLAGVPYASRGRIFDEQLLHLGSIRDQDAPRLVLGGLSERALQRMARYGTGYVHGGGPAGAFRSAATRALIAWSEAGRPGSPELLGLAYFGLGPGAAERGTDEMRAYYAFTGGYAARIASGLLTTPEQVRDLAQEYAEAGCDELVLFPTVPELTQVERLAAAVEALGDNPGRPMQPMGIRRDVD